MSKPKPIEPPDSYLVILYRDRLNNIEAVWNSRAVPAPDFVTLPNGNPAKRTDYTLHAPYNVPYEGDLVLVPLKWKEAQDLAVKQLAAMNDHTIYTQYGSRNKGRESIAQTLYSFGTASKLAIVDRDIYLQFWARAERLVGGNIPDYRVNDWVNLCKRELGITAPEPAPEWDNPPPKGKISLIPDPQAVYMDKEVEPDTSIIIGGTYGSKTDPRLMEAVWENHPRPDGGITPEWELPELTPEPHKAPAFDPDKRLYHKIGYLRRAGSPDGTPPIDGDYIETWEQNTGYTKGYGFSTTYYFQLTLGGKKQPKKSYDTRQELRNQRAKEALDKANRRVTNPEEFYRG
jgi:hypothetical protein